MCAVDRPNTEVTLIADCFSPALGGPVAQNLGERWAAWLEHSTDNREVEGSNPFRPTPIFVQVPFFRLRNLQLSRAPQSPLSLPWLAAAGRRMFPRSKYQHLLEDEGFSAWIENVSRGSKVNAEVSLRRSGGSASCSRSRRGTWPRCQRERPGTFFSGWCRALRRRVIGAPASRAT